MAGGVDLEKLQRFMEVTQMQDPQACERLLEAHDWNLEAAVTTALVGGVGDAAYEAALDHHWPTDAAAAAAQATAGDLSLAQELEAQHGNAANPRVPGVSVSVRVSSRSAGGGGGSGAHAPRRAAAPAGGAGVVALPGLFALPSSLLRLMGSAFGFSFHLLGGILGLLVPQRLRTVAGNTLRRLTLEPPPPSDPVANAHAFVTAFEAAYGTSRPDFALTSYRDALTAANSQFKFCLVYLHSPQHQATARFCRDTLCNPAVLDFVRENFVVWGGDIRQRDAYQLAASLQTTTYPFLAVLANQQSRVTLLAFFEGPHLSAERLLSSLTQVLDDQGAMLVAARAEVEERNYNRLLREEQNREYEESLAADRAREEAAANEAARKAQEQAAAESAARAEADARAEAERQAREAELALEKRREQKGAELQSEPEAGPGVTQVLVRLPDGGRHKRRFALEATVQQLYDFVDTLEGLTCQKYVLATAFPKKAYGPNTLGLTIAEAGLQDAMLTVQSEDE